MDTAFTPDAAVIVVGQAEIESAYATVRELLENQHPCCPVILVPPSRIELPINAVKERAEIPSPRTTP